MLCIRKTVFLSFPLPNTMENQTSQLFVPHRYRSTCKQISCFCLKIFLVSDLQNEKL